MFFLFNKELIFLIVYLDEVHEYIFQIFFRIFSDFLLVEQSLYLDLLCEEIYQKSIQNLIVYLDKVHKYFPRFS